MKTTRFKIKFKRPFDCYGSLIREDHVLCADEEKLQSIVKTNYFLEPDQYKIVEKTEVTLFQKAVPFAGTTAELPGVVETDYSLDDEAVFE